MDYGLRPLRGLVVVDVVDGELVLFCDLCEHRQEVTRIHGQQSPDL